MGLGGDVTFVEGGLGRGVTFVGWVGLGRGVTVAGPGEGPPPVLTSVGATGCRYLTTAGWWSRTGVSAARTAAGSTTRVNQGRPRARSAHMLQVPAPLVAIAMRSAPG